MYKKLETTQVPEIFHMLYEVVREAQIGDTKVISYRDNKQYKVNIVISNDVKNIHILYEDVSEDCNRVGNIAYFSCNESVVVVDLENVVEIAEYKESSAIYNPENKVIIISENKICGNIALYSLELNKEISRYESFNGYYYINSDIIEIRLLNKVIVYSLKEYKELLSKELDKNCRCATYIINDSILYTIIYSYENSTRSCMMYSLKNKKKLYENYNIIDIEKDIKEEIPIIFEDKIVLLDIKTEKEMDVLHGAIGCKRLSGDKILISFGNRIALYSITEHKEIWSKDCKCSNFEYYANNGKYYRLMDVGESVIIIDNEGLNTHIIEKKCKKLNVIVNKNMYCDIVILANDNKNYLDDNNYYICNTKIFKTKEFIEHLGIREIQPIYKKDNKTVSYYRVETYRGIIGKLSYNFRKLQFNRVLNGDNLLDSRFEFLKEKYLM